MSLGLQAPTTIAAIVWPERHEASTIGPRFLSSVVLQDRLSSLSVVLSAPLTSKALRQSCANWVEQNSLSRFPR
jgi:hypothetical protein